MFASSRFLSKKRLEHISINITHFIHYEIIKENHKNEVQKASDGEILSLLKTALHNINEVSGVSSDEDEKNDKDDDW